MTDDEMTTPAGGFIDNPWLVFTDRYENAGNRIEESYCIDLREVISFNLTTKENLVGTSSKRRAYIKTNICTIELRGSGIDIFWARFKAFVNPLIIAG